MSALPQSKKAKAPFRITGDGWYKTRDGKTVKVYLRDLSGNAWRWWSDNSGWHNDAGEFNLRGIPGDDLIARATKPRTPAKPKPKPKPKPKAVRRPRYIAHHNGHAPNEWDVRSLEGKALLEIHAERMTRSTARKLAAWLNKEHT